MQNVMDEMNSPGQGFDAFIAYNFSFTKLCLVTVLKKSL
jgi:hypothetical protein